MIALIDYGMGNLRSVQRALEACGARVRSVTRTDEIFSASGLVFPGQGAFADCLERLRKTGLDEWIRNSISEGRPYLGICLGLQALFESSAEGRPVAGLGVIKGRVVKFGNRAPLVPHMGWNSVQGASERCAIFKGIKDGDYFYFDHSYYGMPDPGVVDVGLTEHGEQFPSVIWRDNLYCVQFHPEKSQSAGLTLIKNFLKICGEIC